MTNSEELLEALKKALENYIDKEQLEEIRDSIEERLGELEDAIEEQEQEQEEVADSALEEEPVEEETKTDEK